MHGKFGDNFERVKRKKKPYQGKKKKKKGKREKPTWKQGERYDPHS